MRDERSDDFVDANPISSMIDDFSMLQKDDNTVACLCGCVLEYSMYKVAKHSLVCKIVVLLHSQIM